MDGIHKAKLTCCYCGAEHQLVGNVTAAFDGGPVDYQAPSEGDMVACTDCGQISFFDSTVIPGGTRKARDPLEEMAATIAKLATNRHSTADIKGHFRRRFEETLSKGGDPRDVPVQARATLQAMYAAALIDVFDLVQKTAAEGGAGAIARLKAYKSDAHSFAEYAIEYAQQATADAAAAKAAEENKQ